jgi:hypothetical protein
MVNIFNQTAGENSVMTIERKEYFDVVPVCRVCSSSTN